MGRVEVKPVAFAATFNTTLVWIGPLTPAVLELAGEPLQVYPVTAGARLPRICCGVTTLQTSDVQTLGKHLEYRPLDPCKAKQDQIQVGSLFSLSAKFIPE